MNGDDEDEDSIKEVCRSRMIKNVKSTKKGSGKKDKQAKKRTPFKSSTTQIEIEIISSD